MERGLSATLSFTCTTTVRRASGHCTAAPPTLVLARESFAMSRLFVTVRGKVGGSSQFVDPGMQVAPLTGCLVLDFAEFLQLLVRAFAEAAAAAGTKEVDSLL